jgi:myo-inositol 2-dehydrogenase/D-chiro-inositol 1-dehydrogenase
MNSRGTLRRLKIHMKDMTPAFQALNRRSFLSNTSKTLAGAAALSALPISRFAHAASPGETIKIALVGAGGRGTGAASQALHTQGEVQLVAVADAFKERAAGSLTQIRNQVKDRPERVKVTDDTTFIGLDGYKQAIALADVVIIATPPGFKPSQFEEAIKQGKHVFMEKPVATDGPGVRQVLAAAAEAKKKNLKVGVGLQRHHQFGYIETIKRIHDGAIGKIQDLRIYWNGGPVGPKATRENFTRKLGRPPTEMEYQVANWYMFDWLCGDHIVEQHIHNIDVGCWVMNGYPVRCNGMGGRQYQKGPDSGEIYDHHAVEYEFEDGTRMFSQCRQIPNTWQSVSEHVVGTKGTSDPGSTIRGENPFRHRGRQGGDPDPYQQEHDDLFEAIRNDKPYNEAENGARSSLAAIMGRMATKSGKIIEMKDALNSNLKLSPDEFTWDAKMKLVPGPDGLYPVAIPGKAVVL